LLGSGTIVGLVLAVFAQVRHHHFLQFDDAAYVTENPTVRMGLSWGGVAWAFAAGHAGNWHPLTWLSHMLDVQLFALDAGRHLLVNVGLHAATSVILFHVLNRLTGAIGPSLWVSALFALHPLHVESVAWVAERKDVLSTFWWVITILAYVRSVERPSFGRRALTFVLFGLALLCKPMVVTLPFILLLLDIWPLSRWQTIHGTGGAALVREKLPLFFLSAVFAVITFIVQREAGAVQSTTDFPWTTRLLNVPIAYITYILKTIWPLKLTALYAYPDHIPIWKSAAAAGALVTATWLTLRRAQTRPYLAVGWAWFIVTLAPVIGIVQVGSQPYADRYMYVPAIGLFVMVAWTVPAWAGANALRRRSLIAAGTVTVLVLAAVSRAQTATWFDSVTLWRHAIAVDDTNYRAHTNLGFALAEDGDAGGAFAEYQRALALRPDFATARNYLGALLTERGRPAEAVTELRAALAVRPGFVEAHNNLGLALAALERPTEAIREFRAALRLNPAFAPAWNNLGTALASTDQLDEAVRAFRESVRYQPSSALAHFNLGMALRDAGHESEARGEFQAAVAADPAFTAAREALRR